MAKVCKGIVRPQFGPTSRKTWENYRKIASSEAPDTLAAAKARGWAWNSKAHHLRIDFKFFKKKGPCKWRWLCHCKTLSWDLDWCGLSRAAQWDRTGPGYNFCKHPIIMQYHPTMFGCTVEFSKFVVPMFLQFYNSPKEALSGSRLEPLKLFLKDQVANWLSCQRNGLSL